MSKQGFNIDIIINLLKDHKKLEDREYIDHIELTDLLHDSQLKDTKRS